MTGETPYADGYIAAMKDLKNEGIEYVKRHADNQNGSKMNPFTIGYRTALGVVQERVAR